METKAPKVLSIGNFDRFSTYICTIELETPPNNKQKEEIERITKQFCSEHAGWNLCIFPVFNGCILGIQQKIQCNAPTEKHMHGLLQALGFIEADEVTGVAPQRRSPMMTEAFVQM